MGRFRNVIWLPIGLYLAAVILFAWNPTPFAQGLAAIAICTAYAHACLTYGWRDGTVFALICLVVSLTVENIGLTTGLMFGHYHFTVGANLPHIGAAPLIVGPLWFGMGYFSWVTAATILRRPGLFSLPALAACVMTSWDLVMDPPDSTISKTWIWRDGGVDFGVPLSNYAGWLFTAGLFYTLFALHRRAAGRPLMPATTHDGAPRMVAILFYVCPGLTQLVPLFIGSSGTIADAAGHLWRIENIREASARTMLLTMLPAALLAARGLRRGGRTRHAPDAAGAGAGT